MPPFQPKLKGPFKEWYRKETWTAADQRDFEIRLKRARSSNRPQYLRIQAAHLLKTGDEQCLIASVELLRRVISDYPEDIERSLIFDLQAECYQRLGKPLLAINSYRRALDAERRRPNVRTNAWLDFGWLIVESRLTTLYDEVLSVLDEFKSRLSTTLKIQAYQYHAVRALIAEEHRERETARTEAMLALDAAAVKHSGFRYHPDVGLVNDKASPIRLRIESLAGR